MYAVSNVHLHISVYYPAFSLMAATLKLTALALLKPIILSYLILLLSSPRPPIPMTYIPARL